MINEEVKEWLKKAEIDLKVIEHELKLPQEEIVIEAVCFHAQQAVEKHLKAFLIHHKIQYKKTHNIDILLIECSKLDNDFQGINVENLSQFGVRIRYPDDFYVPDMEEVKFYYNLANQIKKLIISKLEIKE